MDEIDWFGHLPTQTRAAIGKQRAQISLSDREIINQYGKEYFDGDNPYGYGGYRYDGRFESVAARMIEHYGLNSNSRILEVGCAKGYLLYEFYNQGIALVSGLDISEYAIAEVPEEINDRCFVGSAHDLSHWEDDYFDLVIAKDMIHNLVPDQANQAIKELNRVGRGGAFIQPNSYKTDHQRLCLETWVITIKTIRSTEEWLKHFTELGYTGDYNFLIHDYEAE